jgi:maltooligosyltrehalose trehalohydrolase
LSTDSLPPPESGWGDDQDGDAPSTRRASVGPNAMPAHGARLLSDRSGASFRVWAPDRNEVDVVLMERDGDATKESRRVRLGKQPDGFHVATVAGVQAGALYMFSPDGEGPFPDPASRYQPLGVHGPSQIIDTGKLPWTDRRWRGCPLEDLVIYEVHVGAATKAGTFRALIERLDHVRALGATAIELMPIGDFPGDRNWGYDGVALYAPARCYGTPEDLAGLVDAAHARGLAVILDVVYNHLGPDGNYLRAWSKKYFTDRHKTPWGDALNYDGEGSDAVRALILDNASYWIREFHLDGLRLDATHAILDDRKGNHLLAEIADVARAAASEREILVIAEDERNEARVVREVARGGMGLDAVWADDFHHELRRVIAGDDESYYQDFAGTIDELCRIVQKGWLYEGQVSKNSGHARGTPAFDIPPPRFVHCIQNHDQVGNRATGSRLHQDVELGRYRAAVTLLLSTPFTPLLFMGQEFATKSPFAYFTDHKPELGKLITDGRRNEFAKFRAFSDAEARNKIPDPQARETFEKSKLDWSELNASPGKDIFALHKALLTLRREEPAMAAAARADFDVSCVSDVVLVRRRPRRALGEMLLFAISLRGGATVRLKGQRVDPPEGRRWGIILDTETYGGAKPATIDKDVLTLHAPGAVVLRARAR